MDNLARKLRIDIPLFVSILLLCLISMFLLYSTNQSLSLLFAQSIRILISLVVMLVIARAPSYLIASMANLYYLLGVGLLVLVLCFGEVINNAQRWLDLFIFRCQPAEFMKIILPITIAYYFSERSLPPRKADLLLMLIIILVPAAFIICQPDLGTAILVILSGLSVLFIAGLHYSAIFLMFSLLLAVMPVIWYYLHDYQRQRVLVFLNPEQDPLGAGYHVIQSNIAIGSGGFFGKGWLEGTQTRFEFLPERSTDFIFAVLCEEFGALGFLVLFAIYLFVIYRSFYIAFRAEHTFERLLAGSLAFNFFIYVFVNIAMVSGQLPVVGVTLPMISYGGTSLLATCIGFGILMNIKAHQGIFSPR